MKLGDRGDAVRKVQEALLSRGYDLGVWGADGILGPVTWDALEEFAEASNFEWDPVVPSQVVEAVGCFSQPKITPSKVDTVPVVDVRKYLAEPQNKARIRGGKTVMRPPQNVIGITLHQTAVEYGIPQRLLDEALGDVDLAQALRVQNAACHLIALQEGYVAFTRPLQSYVYHGNAHNPFAIGIEVEGNYRGVADDPDTAWKGNKVSGPVTKTTILAARKAVALAVEEGRRLGMPIKYIWAHRQSSGYRRNDPGEELWKGVVLDYAVPVLGLKTENERIWKSNSTGWGRPIPNEWDKTSKEPY